MCYQVCILSSAEEDTGSDMRALSCVRGLDRGANKVEMFYCSFSFFIRAGSLMCYSPLSFAL